MDTETKAKEKFMPPPPSSPPPPYNPPSAPTSVKPPPYSADGSRGTVTQPVSVTTVPKSRTTAVLLAVFLSFWTWLYSYQVDAKKFWIGLAGSLGGILLLGLPGLGIWIWAVVDVVNKPKAFYANYPRG